MFDEARVYLGAGQVDRWLRETPLESNSTRPTQAWQQQRERHRRAARRQTFHASGEGRIN